MAKAAQLHQICTWHELPSERRSAHQAFTWSHGDSINGTDSGHCLHKAPSGTQRAQVCAWWAGDELKRGQVRRQPGVPSPVRLHPIIKSQQWQALAMRCLGPSLLPTWLLEPCVKCRGQQGFWGNAWEQSPGESARGDTKSAVKTSGVDWLPWANFPGTINMFDTGAAIRIKLPSLTCQHTIDQGHKGRK